MDNYTDRLDKFNSMVNTTADHVKQVQDAATTFKNTADPVGLGLSITGATAGGASAIAGGITGIQHFKDMKTMYSGLKNAVGVAKNSAQTAVGDATQAAQKAAGDAASQANSAGSSASAAQQAAGSAAADTESAAGGTNSGLLSRLQGILSDSGGSTSGQDATDIVQGFRQTTVAQLKGQAGSAVQTTPDSSTNPVQGDNTTNLAPDANEASVAPNASGDAVNVGQSADSDASGVIAQGRQALSNLTPAEVPAQGGGVTQGMSTGAGSANDPSSAANAGANVQQGAADDAQSANSGMRNPNGQSNTPSGNGAGADADTPAGGGSTGNAGTSTGASAADTGGGANAGDEAAALAKAAAKSAGEDMAEDMGLAAFAGPAAPIIGVIGGLVTLGTTIAGLFHHAPPQTKVAPPPPPTSSVGGNLKDNQSGMGASLA